MRLLQEFYFAPADIKGRPRNIHADENFILDPYAKVIMKRRKVSYVD
jgi:hypothetical protein